MFRFLINFFKRLFYKPCKTLDYICGGEALPKPFSKEEEEVALIATKSGDLYMRNKLIEHNLRLVIYIAKKFESTGIDIEDLISIGTIGLIKAINSFDIEKKIKLATYASRCIENEILMHLRRVVRVKGEISFEEPLNVDFEGNELLLSDILGTDSDLVSKNIDRMTEIQILWKSLAKLNKREKQIMWLRFGLCGVKEKTQKEVADIMGISQSYISRLEKKILLKLRKDIVKIN